MVQKFGIVLVIVVIFVVILGCNRGEDILSFPENQVGITTDEIRIRSSLALEGHAGYLGTHMLHGANIDSLISRLRLLFLSFLSMVTIVFFFLSHRTSLHITKPISSLIQYMEQVIFNLITNARDAVNERVETRRDIEQGKIDITSFFHEQMVALIITDNGIGIKHAQLDTIFDSFFTTKEMGEGMGLSLGLPIVQGIVRGYGCGSFGTLITTVLGSQNLPHFLSGLFDYFKVTSPVW